MATNFADILAELVRANETPRNQFGTDGFRPSFGPLQQSTLQRGPSPLGRAFEEGMRIAEQNRVAQQLLNQKIAPEFPGQVLKNDFDPENQEQQQAEQFGKGNPVDRGLFGGALGKFDDKVSNLDPGKVAKGVLGLTPLSPFVMGLDFLQDGLQGKVPEFSNPLNFFSDIFGGGASGPDSQSDEGGNLSADEADPSGFGGGFDFDETGSGLDGSEDDDVGGPGEGGTGPDDESDEGGNL